MSEGDVYDYDVLVIGAGPGGYVAAIRAAQLRLKVACADKRATLGGTCLNVGCIPSKALLHASERYHEAHNGDFKRMGIGFKSLAVDIAAMQKEKQAAVDDLTRGIEFLFKKNKIDWLKGAARFTSADTVAVGEQTIRARNIVVATGSEVAPLAGVAVDNDKGIVVDSTGALALSTIPKQMIVIGGGVIGLELGSVWSRLGTAVTIIEYLDQILPGMDADVRKEAARIFKKQGLTIRTATKVTACQTKGKRATLTIEPATASATQGAETAETKGEQLTADVVLLATGRRPYTEGLGLEAAGLEVNERGQIAVDERFCTAVANIWAIGDVTPGAMLAHRAEDEGLAVAENIAGQTGIVNHALIPSVVYTAPEIASVGLSEAEAKAQGYAVRVGKFPMLANSRAKTNRETDGFVKIVADAESDRVLGVHIIASLAGTMIAQMVQAMEFGASSEDIAYTCHAHPTHSEAIKEAAMAVTGAPIHM